MILPKRIIIVGGNAAGPAAAAKAKRVCPDADVLLFEACEFISTGTCEIPYVLSGEIKDYKDILFYTPESFKLHKKVDVYANHFVSEIYPKEKYILVEDIKLGKKSEFKYDKLVLATGSTARPHPLLRADYKNVFNLKNIGDLISVKEYIAENKASSAAVIGAGYIGLEAADALSSLGLEVILLEKDNLPLPSAEPEIGRLLFELLKNSDIRFFGNSGEFGVNDAGGKIVSLNIEGRIIPVDLVISAAGFVPNVTLARQAGLELGSSGAIKVNRKLQTSDLNIYAAGDNIETVNAVTGRPGYLPLATLAHVYGHIAGENAAGGSAVAEPVVRNISVKVMDKFCVTVGISETEAENFRLNYKSVYDVAPNLVEVMPGSDKVFGKIIYEREGKRILGAAFLGGREVSGYGDLISAFIKTKQPADILADVNYNYTPPLSPFVNLLSKLGRKIK